MVIMIKQHAGSVSTNQTHQNLIVNTNPIFIEKFTILKSFYFFICEYVINKRFYTFYLFILFFDK